MFSIMWSIGALLELEDRAKLELFMREQFELDLPQTETSQTMFEFFVNDEGPYIFRPHSSIVMFSHRSHIVR